MGSPRECEKWEESLRKAYTTRKALHAYIPYGVWKCPADIGAQFDYDIAAGRLSDAPLHERLGESYLFISANLYPLEISPDDLGFDFLLAWDHVGFWHPPKTRNLRDYSRGFSDPRNFWFHNTVTWSGYAKVISHREVYKLWSETFLRTAKANSVEILIWVP